jgi:hypothetical protein
MLLMARWKLLEEKNKNEIQTNNNLIRMRHINKND